MSGQKAHDAPFVEVARSFDAGLRRYEELVGEASRLRVTSEKQLGRAHRALEECAAAEQQLVQLLNAFAVALREAQARQEKAMNARASLYEDLEAKIKTREGLIERLGKLGNEARAVSTSLAAAVSDQTDGASRDRVLASLAEAEQRTEPIVHEAEALFVAARDLEWLDIASDADSLKQQLGAARKKVHALTQMEAATLPKKESNGQEPS